MGSGRRWLVAVVLITAIALAILFPRHVESPPRQAPGGAGWGTCACLQSVEPESADVWACLPGRAKKELPRLSEENYWELVERWCS